MKNRNLTLKASLARLTAVTVRYKIVGDAPTALLKVLGYD